MRTRFLLIFILLSMPVFAIGIVPSYQEISYAPDQVQKVQLKISNPSAETADLLIYPLEVAQDWLSSDSRLELAPGESRILDVLVDMPSSALPGKKDLKLAIRTLGKSTSTIGTGLEIVAKITVVVPYPERFVESRLFVPLFEEMKASSFSVEVMNRGSVPVAEAFAVIDILGPFNNKIDTLRSEKTSLGIGERKILNIFYQPSSSPGAYIVRSTVVYDGQNSFDEKPMYLGSPKIDIDGISVDHFKLGGIAQFEILVSNQWNEPFDGVYADVRVSDDKGNLVALERTVDTKIEPHGKQNLKAYWDTSRALQGKYSAQIDLFYGDRSSTRTFDMSVALDKITMDAGMVSHEVKGEEGGVSSLLVILVVIVLISNGVMIYLIRKKK